MSRVTAAQKARLGLFLLVSGAILAGAILLIVGGAVLEVRDEYTVRFSGSVSGLDVGSQVSYNGIRVGRIERVRIAPDDVRSVEVVVSLEGGTPVKADTRATVQMQGITGLKFIELSGGTQDSALLPPGSTLRGEVSGLDQLTQMATAIGGRLEELLVNLGKLTGEDNRAAVGAALQDASGAAGDLRATLRRNSERIDAILEHTAGLLADARGITRDGAPRIDRILANVEIASAQLPAVMQDGRDALKTAGAAAERASRWVEPEQVGRVARALEGTLKNAERRLDDDEAGALVTELTALSKRSTHLVEHADITLLRIKDDLSRALDEFVQGAEAFAEFAAYLRDNPSALLSGRTEKDRRLP